MPPAPFLALLERVDSTNNYAMAQVHAGLASQGMAWYALEQTMGKGQRGRNWDGERGKNILFSLVLQPGYLKVSRQFHLSAAVALACLEFFSKYAGDETRIKWPNDLYWRDRKAGGILIENVFQGSLWKYAVVGVGININQVDFDPTLKNPVSLKQITGKDFDVPVLVKELYDLLVMQTAACGPGSFATVLKTYNRNLYALNKPVRLKKDNAVFETVVKEVDEQGRLVTVDAVERNFEFGEVEWLI